MILAAIGSLGTGAAVTQLVRWLTDRKSTTATVADTLTGAAVTYVQAVQKDNDGLRAQVAEARKESAEAAETARALEVKFDRVLAAFGEVTTAEREWASWASHELVAAEVPLRRVSPILKAVIPFID